MGAQFDLVENGLQLGIVERVVAARDRVGEAIECGAWDASREQSVANLVEHVEQLLAMGNTLGAAVRGIVEALEHENGIERADGARTADDRAADLARIR